MYQFLHEIVLIKKNFKIIYSFKKIILYSYVKYYLKYLLKKCWCTILKLTVKYHEWTKCTSTGFVLRSHLYNNGVFVADTVLNTITKDINIIKKKIKLGRKNL